MTSTQLQPLVERFQSGHMQTMDFVAQARASVDVEDTLPVLMGNAFARQDWRLLQGLVLVAYHRPSRKYTSVLCRILEAQSDEMTNEDIVEVLFTLADPTSVKSLRGLLTSDLDGDEFHQLNIKAASALGRIGTEEALEALKSAAESGPFQEVRAACQEELERLGN